MEFSEEEIREELAKLGYENVPYHRLQDFKRDLSTLIEEEKSRSISGDSYSVDHTSHADDSRYGHSNYGHSYHREPNLNTSHRYSPRFDKENYRTYKSYKDTQPSTFSTDDFRQPRATYVRPSSSHIPREFDRDLRDIVRPRPKTAWEDVDHSPSKDSVVSESNTSTTSNRRVIKRKVLRKQNGKSRVFNESITTESDPDDLGVSRLSDRLHHMRVLNEDTDTDSVTSRDSLQGQPRQYFRTGMPSNSEDANKKSVIVPTRKQPHTQSLRKSDPVARYQQTQQSWKLNKAPGEKQHKDLRWGIREQMLYHDEVVKKPQRVFVPNSYVVPTDKKRKSLVWQVRADMAKGIKPPVGGFST